MKIETTNRTMKFKTVHQTRAPETYRPGKREKVTDLSRQSQNRLKEKLKTMQNPSYFLTLNIHDKAFFNIKGFEARNRKATRLMKKLTRELERKGYNGFVRKELKIRKSGHYQGQVLPHYHLVLDKEISSALYSELLHTWAASQGLSERECRRYGTTLFDGQAITDLNKVIQYMTKDADDRAIEALKGAPTGRHWYEIGQVKYEEPTTHDFTNNPKGFFRIKRAIKNYAARMKEQYSTRCKKLSKALQFRFNGAFQDVTVFVPRVISERLISYHLATT